MCASAPVNGTWLDLPDDHPYGPAALPYGVFSRDGHPPRVGIRLGDLVLDLAAVAAQAAAGAPGSLRAEAARLADLWRHPSLNPLLAQPSSTWALARAWVQEIVGDARHEGLARPHLHPLSQVHLQLPFQVADYVDFYASEDHARNVGRILRPGSPSLPPQWKHLPIGYHGRAGTVVLTRTPIVRPCGQYLPAAESAPQFGPTCRLDFEAEVGFVLGGCTELGTRIPVHRASEHLFGVVALNDWSARDIQAWEYVPLGPMLGKSFATSVGAWVTPMAALDSATIVLPPQNPPPLAHLRGANLYGLEIELQVSVNDTVISRPRYGSMYWSPAQFLAHLTSNGASVRPGDLLGSGTVSGPAAHERGCLLELSWNGQQPLTLRDGSERAFLHDGDEVSIAYTARSSRGRRIGLGEVVGTILPALPGSAESSAQEKVRGPRSGV